MGLIKLALPRRIILHRYLWFSRQDMVTVTRLPFRPQELHITYMLAQVAVVSSGEVREETFNYGKGRV